MASSVVGSSASGASAKRGSRSPAPGRSSLGPPLDKRRPSPSMCTTSSQLVVAKDSDKSSKVDEGADIVVPKWCRGARERGAELARKFNMLTLSDKSLQLQNATMASHHRSSQPQKAGLKRSTPPQSKGRLSNTDGQPEKGCEQQSRTQKVAHLKQSVQGDVQSAVEVAPIDTIFLKEQLPSLPEDSCTESTTSCGTPTELFPATISSVSQEDGDIDEVLKKSEVLRALLASALNDEHLDAEECKNDEDETVSPCISPCVSPQNRKHQQADTVEVPVSLLDAFSDTCEQLKEAKAEVEQLSETVSKCVGALDKPHKEFSGRDRLSSTSSSCGSTTEDRDSWSLDSRSTSSCSSRQTSTLPPWFSQYPRTQSPVVMTRALSPGFKQALSPTIQHRQLAGSARVPARALSPQPVALTRQSLPVAEKQPVAGNILKGLRPVSCKITQQQTITVTNSVHITVEMA